MVDTNKYIFLDNELFYAIGYYMWFKLMQLFYTNYRKECGLEKFVPSSLAETMKRKELRKLLGHFLKLNSSLTAGNGSGTGQKNLTALQAKLHYLKIISDLPSYGAKCFSTNMSVSIQTSNQNI